MRKIMMLISVLVVMVGCGQSTGAPSDGELNQREVKNTTSEVQDGDFIYRLVTEKSEYDDGKDVSIYAELEYVGEQDSVEISHAASPFNFPMYEATRDYEIGYAMNEPLLTTTLERGEPIREEYQGSGGYSHDDPGEYIEFMNRIIDGDFPKGFYEVNGHADFNYNEQEYKIKADVQFKVN
ncbi:hypothetical protein [Aquisalibacillus elongatus]|uniref:Uncharacterized protein n=1 Tax=Aquisalibacillus elongatus TaxID=485577 RepID=A0A3N5B193_9BACI|nr:hypothetical protein [Aquisalibacillus elongatus]RPF51037.1 hypothetical protein EDC24_2299 [Aquisalibacillus elongatus]